METSTVPDSRTRLSQLGLNTSQTPHPSIPAHQQPEYNPDLLSVAETLKKGESKEDANRRGSLAMHARYAIACKLFS
jgi:hypothetical protein